MEALGGFVLGSGVIIWVLLSPLGALMFADLKQSVWRLLTYGFLLVVSGVLEFSGDEENNLPNAVVIAVFVMNVLGPSLVAFFMLQYFSNQKRFSDGPIERGAREIGKIDVKRSACRDRRGTEKHQSHHRPASWGP